MNCMAQMQRFKEAVANYLVHVVWDGDILNDWLTHIPECGRDPLMYVGYLLVGLLGN